jgi:L-ascorbate metabolism protein UlaG (beta-lactamase superfamily)
MVALILALLTFAQRPALDVRFIGNMAVSITDGTVTVITDFPYESGYSGYMTYAPSEIRSTTTTTLALITHRHRDHWLAPLFTPTTWKVAGPSDVTAGLPADRVVPLDAKTTFGPVTIERFETPHANVGHHSYVVTWAGRRIYFSGDTESPDHLAAAVNLDAAFLSSWLYRAALRRGVRIDAKQIVIYHHHPGERIAECTDRCSVPEQGRRIRIE